jgi:hypothetical protein
VCSARRLWTDDFHAHDGEVTAVATPA